MNNRITDEMLEEALKWLLERNKEAVVFIKEYARMCHRVDDIIDEKITESEFILETFILAAEVYSSNYYLRNVDFLLGFIIGITNDYADSVKWEKSEILWQREHADVLRHAGNKMLFAVIYREGGYPLLRKFSAFCREHSYLKHHTPEGMPI